MTEPLPDIELTLEQAAMLFQSALMVIVRMEEEEFDTRPQYLFRRGAGRGLPDVATREEIMSRLFAFFAAFLFGFALAFASAAWGVFQINDPKHGALFVWTADEMDKLESALQELVAERDALRRRVAEFKRTCT